jgi:hypothetical protein
VGLSLPTAASAAAAGAALLLLLLLPSCAGAYASSGPDFAAAEVQLQAAVACFGAAVDATPQDTRCAHICILQLPWAGCKALPVRLLTVTDCIETFMGGRKCYT